MTYPNSIRDLPETQERMKRLASYGASGAEVACLLNVSRATINLWAKRFGVKFRQDTAHHAWFFMERRTKRDWLDRRARKAAKSPSRFYLEAAE